jgi:bacteriocin-like protein
MKKVTVTGKLPLKKATVSKLNDNQMNNIEGGQRVSMMGTLCYPGSCPTVSCRVYCL